MVHLARVQYEEPDSDIIRQAISGRNQMEAFLITNGPFLPVPPRKRPVATQDNRISNEDQQAASVQFFGTQLPAPKRARITTTVAQTPLLQQQIRF